MRFNDLDAWLRWQETLHPSEIELGLDRISEVARNLDLLNPDCAVITVAGTNGKGSSLAMLDAIYRAAGYSTGLYTSPHIHRYNERIRINGAEVSDDDLCQAFEAVDQARRGISLSYFEFGTLAALFLFSRASLDLMLLEIGLGGRLDAVNIIDADAGLITSIDIDHVEWLGADREQIGREKAGIMRPGQAVVVSDPVPPVSVHQYAQEIGARLLQSGRDYHFRTRENSWDWWADSSAYTGLPVPALKGQFQLHNAAGVLALIESLQEALPVTEKAVHEGLQASSCPGRMMLLSSNPELILDVAHNPQSCRSLADYLVANPVRGRTLAVLGVMADKDVDQMLIPFENIVSEWFLVKPSIPRAMDLEVLKEHVSSAGLQACACDGVRAGVEMASQEATETDRIIVFGSFYTVAEAMPETV